MKIYRFILLLTISIALTSCNEQKDRVFIEGEIAGIKQADFFVYNEEGIVNQIDTVRIVNGQFNLEIPLTEPAILTFLYPNFSRTYIVAEPGKKLEVNGEASKLGSLDVSGSEENELLTKFKVQNVKKPEKETQMAAAQFIRDHIHTMAAVAVLKKYFIQANKHNGTIALPLLKELQKAQPHNTSLRNLAANLDGKMKSAEGSLLPNFTVTTLKGDTITQDDFKGKPLLVLFWAPWNANNYKILKSIERFENKYKEKLNMIIVSVDFNDKLTKIRIQQEGIKSPVVCEKDGFMSPTARALGVRYVPGCLFVNKDGEIIKRDVKIDNLDNEVKKWME